MHTQDRAIAQERAGGGHGADPGWGQWPAATHRPCDLIVDKMSLVRFNISSSSQSNGLREGNERNNSESRSGSGRIAHARNPDCDFSHSCSRVLVIQPGGASAPSGISPLNHEHVNHHINAVLPLNGLTSSEKYVLFILANHANKYGICWPSFTTLSQETGLSRMTVSRALNNLQAFGLISRERRYPSNNYKLLVSQWYQIVTKKAPIVSGRYISSNKVVPKASGTINRTKSIEVNGYIKTPEGEKAFEAFKAVKGIL